MPFIEKHKKCLRLFFTGYEWYRFFKPFLNHVAKNDPGITKILMATIVNDDLKLEILKAGIDHFTEKPLTITSLDMIINELTK